VVPTRKLSIGGSVSRGWTEVDQCQRQAGTLALREQARKGGRAKKKDALQFKSDHFVTLR